jgi:hypothetical protein
MGGKGYYGKGSWMERGQRCGKWDSMEMTGFAGCGLGKEDGRR